MGAEHDPGVGNFIWRKLKKFLKIPKQGRYVEKFYCAQKIRDSVYAPFSSMQEEEHISLDLEKSCKKSYNDTRLAWEMVFTECVCTCVHCARYCERDIF